MSRRIAVWFQALRPYSFTASVIPVVAAAALAFSFRAPVDWRLFPLVLFCAVLLHSATNVFNDYFDFKKGVDTKGSFGSSGVLVEGLESPGRILMLGWVLFSAGVLLSLVLVSLRGKPLFLLALCGFLGVLLYTAEPFCYKYIGLGDFFVFLFMGPLLVTGAYFALTGTYTGAVLYISLPIGFLVTAILSSNNLRDIARDRRAGIITLESLIGFKASQALYIFLIGAAYLSVVILVCAKMLAPPALSVFFTLPLAAKNIRLILESSEAENARISMIDVMTAQLHMAFGLLLTVSILIPRSPCS